MMTWNSLFFHSPNSLMMELVLEMHDYVMLFLVSIVIMVLMNLGYMFYFKSVNLTFFEHHQLESVWTVLPFLVLLFIVIPSISSLYLLDTCMFCGLSVSIVGHQWYWSYFYKDFKNLGFDSYMLPSSESSLRLVEVDNRLVVPSSLPIRFMVSSSDVIHSWTIPSFGVKMDAVPGRINQFCFSAKRSGVFFGQCSEICGANHSFMPIVLEAVSFKNFVSLFF
uniref:Cytochrome c oxidase subunit 2 n=1 Tax=Phyllocoptes taishanensis TaxID=1638174 RepID=A0A0U2PPH7_9ACAR|nr:cytochrome c oxidase subunit II [Phyllocoptes taishanensis]ALK03797.1 cytochrome oxidase subunit 2 [Phyllocoptes taishanensis]